MSLLCKQVCRDGQAKNRVWISVRIMRRETGVKFSVCALASCARVTRGFSRGVWYFCNTFCVEHSSPTSDLPPKVRNRCIIFATQLHFQIRAVTAHTSYGNWWHNSCLQLEDSCWWGIFFGIWLLKHRICGIFGWIQPHYAQGFSPPARVRVGHPGVAWICIYRNTQIR